jgi:hypothetical protein
MKTGLEAKADHKAVDPITLEVIRHGIVSITDQIDANITRTAFSPYIYEYKDFAAGLVSVARKTNPGKSRPSRNPARGKSSTRAKRIHCNPAIRSSSRPAAAGATARRPSGRAN